MVKKKFNDDLFVYLDWILKKPTKEPLLQSTPSIFITNRWLSMLDLNAANIVNATFNRWIKNKSFSSDNFIAGKFYKTVLPKTSKRIFYIKKENKEKSSSQDDESCLAKNLELSQREIQMYNQTLDYLKNSFK
jgi:hypothetical protein